MGFCICGFPALFYSGGKAALTPLTVSCCFAAPRTQMGHRKEAPSTAIPIYRNHGAIWISNSWAGMWLPAGVLAMSYGNFQWLMLEIQTGERCLCILLGRDYRSVLPPWIFLALMFIVLADSPVRPDLCHSFQSSRTFGLIQEENKPIPKGQYSKGKQ